MANYEDSAALAGVISGAANSGQISQATADAINQLIQDLGATGQHATTSITTAAAVTAPILVMAEGTSVNATFGANSDVQAIVLGKTDEASNIVFEGTKDVTVQLGGADGDKVVTAGGDDNITFTGGSATVDTGAGNDTIVLQGDGGTLDVTGGAGDMTIALETTNVAATIDAGDGFDQITTTQARGLFSFLYDAASNVFKMMSRGRAADDTNITMENVNIVSFDEDANGSVDNITVLASNEGQAMVARLYQVALGREAVDGSGSNTNVDGLQFWFENEANGLGGDAAKADLDHVYQSMLACKEFQDNIAGKDGNAIVNMLASNMGNVATVGDNSLAYYAQQIDNGAMSAEDVAILFAQSSEAAQFVGTNGMGYVIDGWA